jgi:hypothetical protein
VIDAASGREVAEVESGSRRGLPGVFSADGDLFVSPEPAG